MSNVEDLVAIIESLEGVSKRLRKVEIISRSSAGAGGSFINLDDTPESYAGQSGWNPVVDGLEAGLEFQIVGSSCVTFVCGAVGWRAIGGSPDSRTLIHETAFQLDTYGNARGDYAVDLQKESYHFPSVLQVAGAKWSVIFGGRANEIDPDAAISNIRGVANAIVDGCTFTSIVGDYNDVFSGTVFDGGYNVTIFGSGNWIQDAIYVFVAGVNNEIEKPLGGGGASCFGAMVFGESNKIEHTAWDSPTYCGQFGVNNEMYGDLWGIYQLGEQNFAIATGEDWWNFTGFVFQAGYKHYAEDVSYSSMFGFLCKSHNPDSAAGSDFLHGRQVLNGDEPGSYPNDGTGHLGGYNQASRFGEADFIGASGWPTSWTTSRFEFPIIQESIWGFIAYITGTSQYCANVSRWKIEGLIKNAGGTTSLVWSTVTNQYRDVTTKEWRAIADDPNDRLVFQFRDTAGPDSTYWNIQFSMQTVEVGLD